MTRLVVGRGWLKPDGSGWGLVHQPDCPADRGINAVIGPSVDLPPPDVRCQIAGQLVGSTLHVASASALAGRSSNHPSVDEVIRRGWGHSTPINDWRREMESWPDPSPLDELTLSETGMSDRANPGNLLVQLVVVKWVSAQMSDWLNSLPGPNPLHVVSVVANDANHLLP